MRAVVFFCMSFVISLVVVTYVVSGQTVEVCDNGIDDNGNGLVDCDDTACQPGFIRKNYFVIEKSGSTSGAIIEDFDNDGQPDSGTTGNEITTRRYTGINKIVNANPSGSRA